MEVQMPMPLQFEKCEVADLITVADLESAGYAKDEASDLTQLAFRQKCAESFFMVAKGVKVVTTAAQEVDENTDEDPFGAFDHSEEEMAVEKQGGYSVVVGFICGTLAPDGPLTEESMAFHDPTGTTLCIHSVCVAKEYQRKGIARRMLKEYRARVLRSSSSQVKAIRLICKDYLIPLYLDAGFEVIGISEVVHGQDPCYEMACDCSNDHNVKKLTQLQRALQEETAARHSDKFQSRFFDATGRRIAPSLQQGSL